MRIYKSINNGGRMKQFKIDGIDYLEKQVTYQSSTAGKIYLPASWTGKKVAVILLEEK